MAQRRDWGDTLVSASIFIEGGGNSNGLHIQCRRAFRLLLEACGLKGRMPRLWACGGREATYGDFQNAHSNARTGDYVGMLVDSEDPVHDINKTWEHLERRDGWKRPDGADEKQVLLMTTCMETWIAADRKALQAHYGSCLQVSALPALHNIESCPRYNIQNALVHASRNCKNRYKKGKRSFELLAKLTPGKLDTNILPSFQRMKKILDENL
jgi:hypothetical protein